MYAMIDHNRRSLCQGVEDAERQIAEHINSLLAEWHAWSAGHHYALSYPTVSATCRLAKASRQYDDANGGLDAHIDHVMMEAVESIIDGIDNPWRTALAIQARNLQTGVQVWSSPRLPSCTVKRAELVAEARKKFREGLARRNLI